MQTFSRFISSSSLTFLKIKCLTCGEKGFGERTSVYGNLLIFTTGDQSFTIGFSRFQNGLVDRKHIFLTSFLARK
ncbi:hypothetical protein XELAEV_18008748mg [Xenopus laevis]|uniref:Uncharacterized protein n=1 Tax=Xenopus laevis TaxID=8355 RepID=A0A974HZS6_XENLA|nr:hypothetical protein XELAEV_18008748mg [Xenopus laevis]